jgi:hypothetical protein
VPAAARAAEWTLALSLFQFELQRLLHPLLASTAQRLSCVADFGLAAFVA